MARLDTTDIEQKINEMDERLRETVASLTASPVRDAMKLVVPICLDQNQIIRDLLALVKSQNGEMMSRTDPRLFSPPPGR